MLTVLSRILNYGFKNFWRNGLLSTATVAIMILALVVFGSVLLFGTMKNSALAFVKDKIDISVYFRTTAGEDDILNVKRSLEGLPEVKSVDYISSGKALEIFEEKHKEDLVITQALGQLNENPLEAYLNVKAHNPDQYAAIAQFLNNPRIKELVDKVNYYENKLVIDRLSSLVEVAGRGGLILALVLGFIAGLVVFNTIRLAIYSNRDEIGIMRAVGASNLFVRGPYMVDGIVAGTLGAIFSMIILAPLAYFSSPYVIKLIPSFDLFQYFYANILSLFLWQLLFGIGIATVSGFIAIRRYLKN